MNSLTETVKTFFNAMAFANVGHMSEFNALLETSEQPAQAQKRNHAASSESGFGALPFASLHQTA